MAVSIGPKIGVDGEAEYRKQINSIIEQSKTLSAQMKMVAASFDASTSATEKARATADILAQSVAVQKERVSALSDMLKKSADAFGENDNRTLKWKQAVYSATAELTKLEKEQDNLNSELGESKDTVGGLSGVFGKLKDSIAIAASAGKESKSSVAALKSEYSSAKSNVAELSRELSAAYREQGKNSQATQDLAAKLKSAKEALAGTKSALNAAKSSSNALGTALKSVASGGVSVLAKGLKGTLKAAAAVGVAALNGLKNTASAVMNGLKSAASIGMKAFTALGAAAAGAIVGLGKIGVEYNAEMEQYTTNFETMLGSQAEAEKKVSELKELAAKTPFEMEGLANATQQLLAMNVASEDTNTILRQLGDISLGDSGKLDSFVRAYGKMNSTGKVTLENINMMAEQGFNPLNEIAKKTGQSMTELYDRLSKGDISLDEIREAMESATAQGGQFYKGMEKASKTFQGMVSTLKDNARALVGEVFKPISDSMTKNLLPGAIEAVVTLTEAFREKGIDGMIQAAGAIVADTLGSFTAAAPKFVNTAVSLVGSLVTGIKDNLPAISAGAISAVGAFASGFVQMLPDIVSVAGSVVQSVAAGIKEHSAEISTGAIEVAKTLISGFLTALPDVADAGLTLLDSLLAGIDENLGYVSDGAGAVISTLISGFVDRLPGIVDSAATIINKLVDGIQQSLPEIPGQASKIIDTLIDGFGKVLPKIVTTGVLLIGQLIAGIAKSFPKIVTTCAQVVEEIVSDFAKNWDQIKQIGGDIVSGIMDGISAAWNTLVNWFNNIWDSLFGKRNVNVNVNKGGSAQIVDGSHASGLNYVPFDGYLAQLHRGEMVLTRRQADAMRNSDYMDIPRNSGGGRTGLDKPSVQNNFGGFTFQIYQQPGESSESLANRIMDMIQTEVNKKEAAFG